MMLSNSLLQLYSTSSDKSLPPGQRRVPSETRCEYVPVRSAPPSMAPHGFGRYPALASFMSRFLHRRFKQSCEGISLWLAVLLMLFVHTL